MLFRLLLSLSLFFLTSTSVQASIYLNEVHPYPETGNDWIEIYNDSPDAVSISNWRFEDSITSPSTIYTFPTNTSLSGNGFLSIEVSNKLNNSGDGIRLLDEQGTEIDSTTYQSSTQGLSWSRIPELEVFMLMAPTRDAPNPLPSPSPSPTLPPPSPTPWPTPSPSPFFNPLDITLNEIMACPGENQSEWVELFNGAETAVTLENWRITDWAGNVRTFDVTLPPMSTTSISWLSSMLNNTGDSLFLENNVGDIIAAASFSSCAENQSFIWTGYQWQLTTTPTADSQNVLTSLPSTQASPSPKSSPRPTPTPSPTAQPKTGAITSPQILGKMTGANLPGPTPINSDSNAQHHPFPPQLTIADRQSTPPSKSKFIAVRPSKVPIWSAFNVILGGLLISSTSAYFVYDYFQQILDRPLA